jgi:tRNA threonylcarbamoyladenosine biosynthesis protein TsaE
MREHNFDIHDETQQLIFGEKLAKSVDDKACVIFLQGDLGAGKTTLVRGFLRGMGFTEKVKSPTYSLIEIYELLNITVLHLDLYRLKNPGEIEALSLRDYLSHKAILLVEWSERAESKLPQADLHCLIATVESGRKLQLKANTLRGEEVLQKMVKMT